MSSTDARSDGDDDRTTFEGVERPDGRVGVRNAVLVLPSVICSHVVADRIAERVEGAVSAPHDHGCGQIGADEAQTRRAFLGLAANPNVAGTVVVGLGCETVQSDEVAAELADRDVPVRELSIQEAGGTDACIERGVEAARELRAEETDGGQRTTTDASDLTVGVVCSDLNRSSKAVADPLVGGLVDDLIAGGARVVATGTERLTAHPDAAREAASESARADLDALLERHRETPSKVTRVARDAAATDFETVTAAWGRQPIREVLDYGEPATLDAGLAVVDATSEFGEAATALAAAGAQIVVHVTADGEPAGHPVVPVVKVTGDADVAAALSADVDVDATSASRDELRETVFEVADGEPCRAERHGLTQFAIARVGPSM